MLRAKCHQRVERWRGARLRCHRRPSAQAAGSTGGPDIENLIADRDPYGPEALGAAPPEDAVRQVLNGEVGMVLGGPYPGAAPRIVSLVHAWCTLGSSQ